MGSLSSKNRGAKYLLCIINVFTKYIRHNLLKDEKAEKALNDFIEIVNESKRKPNKSWTDQGK